MLFSDGGRGMAEGREKPEIEDDEAVDEENQLDGLWKVYALMEKALGLVVQGTVIDYSAIFLHADLTMREFEALQ